MLLLHVIWNKILKQYRIIFWISSILERLRNKSLSGTYWTFLLFVFTKSTVPTPYDESKVTQSNGLISGICLYLSKQDSALYPYHCSGFLSGCPNTSFISDSLFESMLEIIT